MQGQAFRSHPLSSQVSIVRLELRRHDVPVNLKVSSLQSSVQYQHRLSRSSTRSAQPTMRFTISTLTLAALSFAVGSLADSPSYVRTFGVQGDGHGSWRGAPPILLDMNTMEIYLPPSSNNLVDPELRFQLVGVSILGVPTTTARLVEYPGYDTTDQGYYMSKPSNGSLIYSVFDESTDGIGPWWLVKGPENDPQYRLTFKGSSVAKAWWDASKNRYKVYMGADIPANLTGLIDIDMKVTQYCGAGYTYCT